MKILKLQLNIMVFNIINLLKNFIILLKNFELQKERDIFKLNKCKENGIKLIIIPYTCNTFETITNEIKTQLNIKTKNETITTIEPIKKILKKFYKINNDIQKLLLILSLIHNS